MPQDVIDSRVNNTLLGRRNKNASNDLTFAWRDGTSSTPIVDFFPDADDDDDDSTYQHQSSDTEADDDLSDSASHIDGPLLVTVLPCLTQSIKRVEVTKGMRTLGIRLAPDGNDHDEYKHHTTMEEATSIRDRLKKAPLN
jgi:hypothetical protein